MPIQKDTIKTFEPFFKEGGEMGELIRTFDWCGTAIGKPDTWPQSLLTTINILLNSRFPMLLFWGPELIQFYNDSFRVCLGNDGKHPKALGQKGENCWVETWPVVKPLLDQVYAGGEAIWAEDQLIPIYRNGRLEDVYWTFSYSSVNDDAGNIGGVLVICNESTDKIDVIKAKESLKNSEEKYHTLFSHSPLPKWIYDSNTLSVLEVNNAAINHYGYSREEFLNMTLNDLSPLHERLKVIDNSTDSDSPFICKHIKKDKSVIDVEVFTVVFNFQGRDCRMIVSVDVTDKLYYEQLDKLENNLLSLNARGDIALNDLLETYLKGIEKLHAGMICSIQELTGNKIYNQAAPSLPKQFLQVIEGGEIGPEAGSCGTAAFLKKKVIVTDIATDIYWTHYKEAALMHGLKACWSNPIFDKKGNVIGTFASYFKEVKYPSEREENTIQRAVNILQIILEDNYQEKVIKLSNERFEYATEATSEIIWDWNLETNHVYYSKNMNRLFGHTPNPNIDNLPFYFENVHPDDRERVVVYPNQVIFGPMNNWSQTYRFRKADGTYAFILDKGRVIRDDKGKGIRVVGAMQDISKQKEEENRLRLFESIITNTNDAVLVTEADQIDKPGPLVLYVNDAFTKMTGYTSEDMTGKTPRMLQGERTDQKELQILREAIRKGESSEVTLLNYKKNGQKFWVNIILNPIVDDRGKITHFLAIERDVTMRKTEEMQKILWSEISQTFNEPIPFEESLNKALNLIANYGQFILSEAWLINSKKNKIHLAGAFYANESMKSFHYETAGTKSFLKGQGITGKAWEKESLHIWEGDDDPVIFQRAMAAKKNGLVKAYALPLFYNKEIIGVLLLGLDRNKEQRNIINAFGENFSGLIGAEIKRKQAEQDLNHIFNFAPDIICIVSSDGYFKKINPAAVDILEYSEAELVAVPFFNFIHPEDISKSEVELTNLNEGRSVYYFENRYLTKSGKIKWLAWTSMAPTDEESIFAVAKDITAKKELENLLKKANDLARIGGWEYDLSKASLYWTEITRDIYEVDTDFIPDLKNAMSFYIKESDKALMFQNVEDALRYGTCWDQEIEILTAKGNKKWIRYIGESELVNGSCSRLYGSIQDVDIRKKVELALEESLLEKNDILESIGDGFFAVSQDWTVTYWNKQAEKELLRSKKEMIGKNLWEIFEDNIGLESYKKYHEALKENKAIQFEDYFSPVKKWFDINAYPSKNGLSVYFKDVTERKIAEQKLNELNDNLEKKAKELMKSNTDLEQFAYVASHDLQEPLRMISSFLLMLEKNYRDTLDEKGKKYIHFAVDGANRMQQIILDLLDFSLIDRSESYQEKINLDVLVDEVLKLFVVQIEEKKAEFEIAPLPEINAYKTHLRQIFQNLISNALKYSKKDVPTKIKITAIEKDDTWQFSISDNGIGIEEKYFQKIFVMFQRLHLKTEFNGTGMGLAITKKIVNNIGGQIFVESVYGEGSTFKFTIPKTPLI